MIGRPIRLQVWCPQCEGSGEGVVRSVYVDDATGRRDVVREWGPCDCCGGARVVGCGKAWQLRRGGLP